jgi:IS4 transposase
MGRGWKRAKSAPRQSLTRQLFFKALKQNLTVKSFLGTSENALRIQIWTALIALLLLKWLHHLSNPSSSRQR